MSSDLSKLPGQTAFKVTWVLSICAMSSAVISYSVTHWAFPPVGYEGMLVLTGLAIWCGIACIAGAVFLSSIILIKRRSQRQVTSARWSQPRRNPLSGLFRMGKDSY